ncbi:MAG: substrate-binding domain-containing protein [Anaerolineae bacterium]
MLRGGLLLIAVLTACSAASEPQVLTLATTTSTENSGLLAYILPDFEKRYNAQLHVVAVGTGQALEIASRGDADLVLVHARPQEDAFMEAGHGLLRKDVMYNDFLIIGPDEDRAGISGLTDAALAFTKIAEAESLFISRGDESGTHAKELEIWEKAGLEPPGGWYISAGAGMGAVLTMAQEKGAYTITDRATYLARTLEGFDLPILVEGDPILFNPYGVIVVSPEKHCGVNSELAEEFVGWLTSLETQKLIGQFGVEEFGQPLFIPDSEEWRGSQGER